MNVGFTYRVTRSRESLDLVKLIDKQRNFLRTRDPNASSAAFYDWDTEIGSGREHLIKLYDASHSFYDSVPLSTVGAHELTTSGTFNPLSPYFGAGDTYEVCRREDNNSLTVLVLGAVGEYQPATKETYRLKFEITSAGGMPQELFLIYQTNKVLSNLTTQAGTPTPQRVLNSSEVYNLPSEAQFTLDASRVGIQKYRAHTWEKLYETEQTARDTEGSLLGQLQALSNALVTPQPYKQQFTALPGTATIQIGEVVQMDAVGETGSVVWTMSQNESGATLTSGGLYRAGDTPGTDIVVTTDSAGNQVTSTFTVTNTFTAIFEGEYILEVPSGNP